MLLNLKLTPSVHPSRAPHNWSARRRTVPSYSYTYISCDKNHIKLSLPGYIQPKDPWKSSGQSVFTWYTEAVLCLDTVDSNGRSVCSASWKGWSPGECSSTYIVCLCKLDLSLLDTFFYDLDHGPSTTIRNFIFWFQGSLVLFLNYC